MSIERVVDRVIFCGPIVVHCAGIGNAVTDILVEVDYSFLKKNELEEGAMQLVDEAVINNLLSVLELLTAEINFNRN